MIIKCKKLIKIIIMMIVNKKRRKKKMMMMMEMFKFNYKKGVTKIF